MGKAGPAEEVCAAAAPTAVEPVTFGLGKLEGRRAWLPVSMQNS